MSDGIGLHKTGLGDVPVVGADGNLVFEQTAGRVPASPLRPSRTRRGLSRGQQALALGNWQRAVAGLVARQSERDNGLQRSF